MTSPVHQAATIWFDGDIPDRMIFAGQRWRVTDMSTPLQCPGPYHQRGWRFQGTNDDGEATMFDVYEPGLVWHVHKTYV